MQIKELVSHTNRLTGQGTYTTADLLPYFDECIDEINEDLGHNLPTVTAVYKKDFSPLESEDFDTYHVNDDRNRYSRIPDSYLRNYLCYEASYRILRDEDEDEEVYRERQFHANRWYRKLRGRYLDIELDNNESILVNGDIDEGTSPYDGEEEIGFYNPYFPSGDE